jgi:hypothetical protein
MTIADAAESVLKEIGTALHSAKIADEISRRSLYQFGTKDPAGVVSQALRKKCRDESGNGTFVKAGPNTFGLAE